MRRAGTLGALLLTACGFLSAPRENPAIPPDGFGPWEETGTVALCQDGVALVPTGPDTSGFCVPTDAPAATACGSDDDCESRERCSCGRCVVPFCTGNESCRAGETCLLGSSQCGQACAIDDDCTGGMACARGRCAQRCATSDECQRGESCSRLNRVCVAISCDAGCAADERCEAQRSRRELVEPAVVDRDGELLLFVEDRGHGTILRGHGTSAGAFEIEPAALIEDAGAPAPLLEGGAVFLYFVRADRSVLLRAAGADGALGAVEELYGPRQGWEGAIVDAPSAALVPDQGVVVAYEAAGGIGLLREDGGEWVSSAEPIVTAETLEDPILWRAVTQPGSPTLIADRTVLGEPRLRLWVDARGAEGSATIVGTQVEPPPINWSIGTLVSVDGGASFVPSPFNPTFARVAELGRYKAESDPWVLPTGGGYRLWFVGADVRTGTPEGLGSATMAVGSD